MIERKFILTYIDSRGRLVHRANHDGRWYWDDLGMWRRLRRRPKLIEYWGGGNSP